MFSPTKTVDIQAACRHAYQERDQAAFAGAATHLLIRGYAPVLGPRGGLSFTFVGATVYGDRHHVAVHAQFAGVEWK